MLFLKTMRSLPIVIRHFNRGKAEAMWHNGINAFHSRSFLRHPMNIHCRYLRVLAIVATYCGTSSAAQSLRDWHHLADEMVNKEIVAAGVKNERVVKAMRDTPRHEFVPLGEREH